MAVTCLTAGNAPRGAVAYRKVIEIAPSHAVPHLNISLLESSRGNNAAALEEARIGEQLLRDSSNPSYLGIGIYAFGRLGQRADAERLFKRLEDIASSQRIAAVVWVHAYLGIGDRQRALAEFRSFADTKAPWFIGEMDLKFNVHDDPVLDQPEFVEVRSRLGFTR